MKSAMPGRVFDRLTVTGEAPGSRVGYRLWVCRCVCGTRKVTSSSALVSGRTRSCGCLQREVLSAAPWRTHGKTWTREYETWRRIKTRCLNKRNGDYPAYGGRGITICDRWKDSFENFLADMGPRPSPRHSIDRFPNNDGPYSPENCRWATPVQQARNRRKDGYSRWKKRPEA